MGYYTDFDISGNSEEIAEAIEETSGYFGWYDRRINAKWYDWQNHCLKVSERFPEEIVVVEGVGEEHGDMWKAYFNNGKMQIANAVITYEPFDKSKLE